MGTVCDSLFFYSSRRINSRKLIHKKLPDIENFHRSSFSSALAFRCVCDFREIWLCWTRSSYRSLDYFGIYETCDTISWNHRCKMSVSALAVFVLLNGMHKYTPVENGTDLVGQPVTISEYFLIHIFLDDKSPSSSLMNVRVIIIYFTRWCWIFNTLHYRN